MNTSRRDFLTTSAFSAAALAAGAGALARPAFARPHRDAPKRILILGGTGFLGPACMESALAAGHKVTLFNSGRTEERRKAGHRPSVVPDGVEVIIGNRDPEKTADERRLAGLPDDQKKPDPNSPKGLSELAKAIENGARWDAVIDTSGYWPRMVKASASLLAPAAGQYIFISTLSVYKNNNVPFRDESDELATLADPATEEFGADFSNYGGGKALCEAAAEAAMPGRVANIRPGFIVGERDSSGRFIYWPVRATKGGEMIVPGKPDDFIQIIDVRDLADFVILCIRNDTNGPMNATGEPIPMQQMVDGCIKAAAATSGAKTSATWVDPEFLTEQGVEPQRFPLWIPPDGEAAGFHRRDVSRAVKAGLTFRPVEVTARSTIEWYNSLPSDLQSKVVPPMLGDKEQQVLEAWHKKQGG